MKKDVMTTVIGIGIFSFIVFLLVGNPINLLNSTGTKEVGVSTDSSQVPSGEVTLIDASTVGTNSETQLSGHFTNIRIPSFLWRIAEGQQMEVTVQGSFSAATTGDYYIEAGMIESSFTPLLITGTKSLCDGSVHWAGQTVHLNSGESANFALQFKDYGKQGYYRVIVGAYSGKLVDGKPAGCGTQPIVVTESKIKLVEYDELQQYIIDSCNAQGGTLVGNVCNL